MAKKSEKRKKEKLSQQDKKPTPLQGKCGAYYPFIAWGLVVAAMVFIAAIRIRLLSIPLERDEGEFAYMGQLMLQGIPPYSLAANMKLPGTYAAYALIMALFGQTIEAVHLGLLLINTSTMLMVFLLARRLFDDYTGVVACATYGILSLSPSVLGTSAHATHFVLLPALGGIILLLKAIESGKQTALFWSGLLFGLSFLMKQPGIFFGCFALFYLMGSQISQTRSLTRSIVIRTLVFTAGLSIPCLLTCLTLYALGVFQNFWFWTVAYASEYGSLRPLSVGIAAFFRRAPLVIDGFYLLWMLAGIGILVVSLKREMRIRLLFMYGFFIFSFLAVCPGLYFREHYFILLLPAVALFVGISTRYFQMRFAAPKTFQVLTPLLFLICFCHGVASQKLFFFTLNPVLACRYMYFPNPFPESIAIADYIKNHTTPDSTIAVLGSEPQIYFYAHRRSATSYIYTYGLMENHKYALAMQREMIKDIERNRPEYLVFVKTPTSWLMTEESNTTLLDWFKDYQLKYSVAGIIEIVSVYKTIYLWDDQAQNYNPRPDANYVLRRDPA